MRLVRVVGALLLGLLVLALVGAAAVWFVVFAPVSTVGEVDFDTPLAVPPEATSRVEPDGTRVFELTAQQGIAKPAAGVSARSWGFNGARLGPTLRAARGEHVRVEVTNALDETTSVHWHGMHVPAEADGGPHQPVEPGDTWTPSWTLDQPSATLWYHPHPHGATEDHVARGLAGMFIVDDPDGEVADALPHDYGVDDVPVIVQDGNVDDGGLLEADGGDQLLVNGTLGPYLDVTTERVRLRLLNASVERVYDFGLSDDRPLVMIGSDGGLLPEPVETSRVRLSPGERAEVVVQMSPGEDVVLRSYPPDLGTNAFVDRFNGGQDEFDVLQLSAADTLTPSPDVPARLAPAPDLDVEDAKERTFVMQGRSINGRSMDMSRIDAVIELGATEVWEVRNTDGEYHNFHAHDVQFQVLSVDGEPPPRELSGWKDTVYLRPGGTVRLATQFTDHADPDTPYMFHCHLLQHEDNGMMGQFVVVKPGDNAGTVEHSHH